MLTRFSTALIGIMILLVGCVPLTPMPEAAAPEDNDINILTNPEVAESINAWAASNSMAGMHAYSNLQERDIFDFVVLPGTDFEVVGTCPVSQLGETLAEAGEGLHLITGGDDQTIAIINPEAGDDIQDTYMRLYNEVIQYLDTTTILTSSQGIVQPSIVFSQSNADGGVLGKWIDEENDSTCEDCGLGGGRGGGGAYCFCNAQGIWTCITRS